MRVMWRSSLREVQRYLAFADLRHFRAFERQLERLHYALESWSIRFLEGPGVYDLQAGLRLRMVYCLVIHVRRVNDLLATETKPGIETTMAAFAHAFHEYIDSLLGSTPLSVDVSSLCQVSLNLHTRVGTSPRIKNRYKLFDYFSAMLIGATLGTEGENQAESVALFSAISLCRLVASQSSTWWRTIPSLFLAGTVLTKSRHPQGIPFDVFSHRLEYHWIVNEFKKNQFQNYSSEYQEACALIPAFWDLADHCSNLGDLWRLSYCGRTTLQMFIILG
jgi:hypothetical protein